MAKSKKNQLRKWISIGLAVVIVVGGGITALAAYNNQKNADSTTTLTKATVKSTTLKTTVSGSGSVSNGDEYALTAPGGGTIDTLNVKQGDTVKAGDVIAHINGTNTADTVMQKQSALDNAKNNLTTAQNQLNSLYVKAPVDGRVKSIVPSVGDSMSDIKAVSNSMALISMARAMTVSVSSPQKATSMGETVGVYDGSGTLLANGTVVSGASISSGAGGGSQGGMTVQIDTDTPAVNTQVTVKTADGSLIGTGKLQLVSSVSVTSQSSDGIISNIYVSENQMVSKRDNLFKFSSTSVNNQIAQAQKAVTLAEDDLANANTALNELTIKSPIDGTIAQLNVKQGTNINNGGSIATIINPNLMQTVVSVDELDISKVQIGQAASITIDALSKTFTGSVTAIDEIGSTSNGVASYNVTVSIDNPENVKVGMTTNAAITTSSVPNVIVVPTAAVLKKTGTTGYVLSSDILGNETTKVLNNANIDELVAKYGKKVTIGSVTSNQYQITDGLKDGDNYVVAVTVSKSAVKSLSNTASSTTNGFGGMGGFGGAQGMPGNGYTRQNGTTGNRTTGNTGNRG